MGALARCLAIDRFDSLLPRYVDYQNPRVSAEGLMSLGQQSASGGQQG